MPKVSRRGLLRLGLGLAASGLGACAQTGFGRRPSGGVGSSGARVVVVGGGFAGAIAAKYIKQGDPSIDLVLVERNRQYLTAPFSSTVLAGMHDLDFLSWRYDALADEYAIGMVYDEAVAIDATVKRVSLSGGRTLSYDRLVVAPGVGFRWNGVEGYDQQAAQWMPHAWRGAAQLTLLRDQLRAMRDGGLVIIAVPAGPFSGPAAPYERASLVAHYLKRHNPRAKVLLLDSGDSFPRQALFTRGWEAIYPGMIEWVPGSEGGHIVRVDPKAGLVQSASDKYRADVVNLIPPQQAGTVARRSGLANADGWCPVEARGFESERHRGIHVVGDACIAGDMPKSGFAANSQAKVAAAAVVDLLNGRSPGDPSYLNGCYSLLNSKYGISEAQAYRLAPNGRITAVKDAGGVSADKGDRLLEAAYADSWYANITADMFASAGEATL